VAGGPALPAVGRESFAARERGGTVGVARSGDRAVFASSTEPKTKRKGGKAAPPSASERSAGGDAWSGFDRAAVSPAAAAASSPPPQQGGPNLAMAMLGLGLVGVLATVLAAAAPRHRRAAAKSASAAEGK